MYKAMKRETEWEKRLNRVLMNYDNKFSWIAIPVIFCKLGIILHLVIWE